jgi:polysaccharide pyruvyl transferase WcaK-like protein
LGATPLLTNTYSSHFLKKLASLSDSAVFHKTFVTDSEFDSLDEFDYIGVRGPKSAEILSQYDIESRVVGDTALVLEPSKYVTESHNRIAVTLRTEGFTFAPDREYHNIIEEFCINNSDKYKFIFVPFYSGDIAKHVKLAEKIDRAEVLDYSTYINVPHLLDELAHCDLVIGERLHDNVLSVRTHSPFISIGYQPKSEDFARSVGMERYNIRADQLTRKWLDQRVEETTTDNDIREELVESVSERRSKLQKFVDLVSSEITEIRQNDNFPSVNE